jgi:hypothetical protein
MSEGPASSAPTPADWFRPGRFALVLGVMVFVPFWDVLLGLRTFAVRDFGLFSFPVASYFRDCFWRGEWPLWNPLSCLGTPFLAQLNTLTLYPPSLIYLLLPLTWALPFFCLLHLYLGGLGMYFLATRWSGSRLGGAVAGTVFAFNGLSLNFLMWPSHIATFALMPWVIWLTQQAWESGGRKIILAALLAALQVLAGGPETILLTWLVLAALAVAAMVNGAPVAVARRFLAVGFLAVGLTAVQMLPFADLSLHSNRSTGIANAAWSMPAWGWANILVPLFHTSRWQQIVLQDHQDWTSSYYAGVGTVFLAAMAMIRSRTWRVWLLGAMLGLSLVLALGDHGLLFTWLQRALPFIGLFRYPVKFVLAAMLALPLLAAVALGAYERLDGAWRDWRPELFCGGSLLALMGLIVWFAKHAPAGNLAWTEVALNGTERAALLVAIIGMIYLLVTRPEWRGWTGLALVAVFWLDVVTHEPWQNPTADPSIYQRDLGLRQADFKPGPPVVGESRLMQSPYSVRQTAFHTMEDMTTNYLLERAVFQANCNLLDGVPKVDGFFSLYLRHTDKVLSLFDTNVEARLSAFEDVMAVAQTIAPGKVFDWTARPVYVPWITTGQGPVFADEPSTLQALANPSNDFRNVVYLPTEAQAVVTAKRQEAARVTCKLFSPERIVLSVETPGPTMVCISQAWYHNWKATVDSAATTVWRANEGFQAVESPQGKHEIIVYYDDRAFKAGGGISMMALVICVIAWCYFGKRGVSAKLQ